MDVVIAATARAELLALLEAQAPNRSTALLDAIVTAATYLEDLVALFDQHDGRLPGAIEERAPDDGDWWWRYTNGVWVIYRTTETRRWFRSPLRAVRIVGFEAARPVA
jgi:hypothetical protein